MLPHLPLVVALATALAADTDADAALQRHLALAEQATRAEREGRPADAIELCRRTAEALPDGPRTPRCASRVAFLEARRDVDGGFAGWVALERARAGFRTAGPDATRAAIEGLLLREGLATSVRGEAETWLAADDLDRKSDPAAALAHTDALYAERATLDEDVRRVLITVRARALARLGRAGEAKTVEDEIRVAAPAPRPTPVDVELRRQRDARLTTASWAALAAFAAVTVPAAPRGLRAGPRPWGLVPIALAVGGAWLIARLWVQGADAAMPWMAAGFVAVHGLAVLARPPGTGRAWRVVVGALAVAATLAVAWLALERADALGWVGLGGAA